MRVLEEAFVSASDMMNTIRKRREWRRTGSGGGGGGSRPCLC